MNAMDQLQQQAPTTCGKRVRTVLRVSEEGRYAGDILLDGEDRVWRHARTIPRDVVLRVLLHYTRQGEVCGKLERRADGRTYLWFVVGAVPASEGEGEGEGEEGDSDLKAAS